MKAAADAWATRDADRAAVGRELHRVRGQLAGDLLQLALVGPHHAQRRIDLGTEAKIMFVIAR